MRFSSSYIPTLKEIPADAEAVSHQLLLRAGLVRRLTSGLYTYLPLGLKVIDKISRVIREEMNKAGFQELLMPMVQPADLWKETGRWKYYGKELLRFKDRNDREYCLGPTHEEVVTDLVRSEVRSYRQLPVRVFQIQTKFRDEMRPRFGLMRGREFLMKDAYSFDADSSSAKESYNLMFDAYTRIFKRLGLEFRAVEADTGSIGGNFSHEFMVLADSGEDTIVSCSNCEYAANVERAEITCPPKTELKSAQPLEKVMTPGKHTVEEVTAFLGVPAEKLIKTLIFNADGKTIAVLVRGDREVNEIKLKKLIGAQEVEMSSKEVVEKVTKAPLGFAGPVGLNIPIYADNELGLDNCYITGANEKDAHYSNVELSRDATITAWADLRNITASDKCPKCKGDINLTKGIEAGHIFMLEEKYSKPMKATFLDENGVERTMIQGCYGIGVSRIAAACIEQNHDENGIIFPPQISPVDCIFINLDPKNDEVSDTVDNLSRELEKQGIEILIDDRQERPGVKFNDADLLGIPLQLLLGAKSLKKGIIECKDRRTGEKGELSIKNFMEDFNKWRERVYKGWDDSVTQKRS